MDTTDIPVTNVINLCGGFLYIRDIQIMKRS